MDWQTHKNASPTDWIQAWTAEFRKFFELDVDIKINTTSLSGDGKRSPINLALAKNNMIAFSKYEIIEIGMETKEGEKFKYNFSLYPMPALCGTVVLTYMGYYNEVRAVRKADTCLLLLEFVKSYADFRGYKNIIATNIVPRGDFDYTYPSSEAAIKTLKDNRSWFCFKFKQNLLRAGFTVVNEYTNARSNNLINIFNINL